MCNKYSKDEDIRVIYIVGLDCAKSQLLINNTKKAIKDLGISVKIKRIKKLGKSNFNFLPTPILAIDNNVLSMGKVLSSQEIKNYLLS